MVERDYIDRFTIEINNPCTKDGEFLFTDLQINIIRLRLQGLDRKGIGRELGYAPGYVARCFHDLFGRIGDGVNVERPSNFAGAIGILFVKGIISLRPIDENGE
jgi:hypothetical protein